MNEMTKTALIMATSVIIALLIGFMVMDKVNVTLTDMRNFCVGKEGILEYRGNMSYSTINCTAINLNETTYLSEVTTV